MLVYSCKLKEIRAYQNLFLYRSLALLRLVANF